MYKNGQTVKQNFKKAKRWFEQAAAQGYKKAMHNLAMIYANGAKGVQRDYKKALEWYEKAALHGYQSAWVNLGCMYAQGQGCEQDHSKAAEW